MSLTWRDVAGQVQAPDLGDATTSITRGLQLLADAAQQPEQRRQAQLAREIASTEAQSRILTQTINSIQQQEDRKQAVAKEKALKEFSTVESVLLDGARQAGLKGMALEDFLKGNETYQKLGDDAKAFGASRFSDAYGQGMSIRERAMDDARQQSQWERQFAQQAQSHRDSLARQDRDYKLRLKEIEERSRRERESRGFYSNDPETNMAFQHRYSSVAEQLAPVREAREKYGKMTPAEAAKLSGMDENWWAKGSAEAQSLARSIEQDTGKKVDTWMINKLLAEGGNADNWDINPAGGLDDNQAKKYLLGLVELQRAASENQRDLDTLVERMRNGEKFTFESLAAMPIKTGITVDPPPAKKRGSAPARTMSGNRGMNY